MKNDWISIIIMVIMVTTLLIGLQWYYNSTEQQCRSNPLVYGAKYMEEQYGYPFEGRGFFKTNTTSPIIYFNKNNISSEYYYSP